MAIRAAPASEPGGRRAPAPGSAEPPHPRWDQLGSTRLSPGRRAVPQQHAWRLGLGTSLRGRLRFPHGQGRGLVKISPHLRLGRRRPRGRRSGWDTDETLRRTKAPPDRIGEAAPSMGELYCGSIQTATMTRRVRKTTLHLRPHRNVADFRSPCRARECRFTAAKSMDSAHRSHLIRGRFD